MNEDEFIDLKEEFEYFEMKNSEHSLESVKKIWKKILSSIIFELSIHHSLEYNLDDLWVTSLVGPLNEEGQKNLFRLILNAFSKFNVIIFDSTDRTGSSSRYTFNSHEQLNIHFKNSGEFTNSDQIEIHLSDRIE